MARTRWAWCVAMGAGLWGCGDDSSGSGSAASSEGGVSTVPGSSESGATADTTSGSNSASASISTTVPTDESGPPVDSSGPPPIGFDVGGQPDLPPSVCQPGGKGGGNGDPEFSFLWASNSAEGTISKIDTQTVTEVGRYATRPDAFGSPSRTSVSLTGNVAVANREGGITKFYANQADCMESNGMAGLQTSDSNVALPWDQEECRAWYIPFDYDSQRPVAWAPGDWNEALCTWQNERLWTAGRYGQVQVEVLLIDGDAGVVLDTVDVPGLKADQFGLYGGAVDAEGNFWASGWATGNQLVRVDIDTMDATVWPGPSVIADSHWYGMTVDVNGYVWNCASRVARFDPADESWTVSDELPSWSAGCMADADPDGLLWLGSDGTGLFGIDRETFELVHQWPTPTAYGVSIDFYGYVWAVNGNGAHRVDPESGVVTSYNGLTGAYTYSDMTGYALNTVGGGIPSG